MTTFQIDTWDPRFNLLFRCRFTGVFEVFECVVDVFRFEFDQLTND